MACQILNLKKIYGGGFTNELLKEDNSTDKQTDIPRGHRLEPSSLTRPTEIAPEARKREGKTFNDTDTPSVRFTNKYLHIPNV